KPQVRLPRHLDWDQVKLGCTREEALRGLPTDTRNVLKLDTADGFVITFGNDPAKTALLVPRQLVLRFDAAERLVGMRERYENAPAGKGFKDLLAGLQKKGGAAAESPSPWASLWRGLPEKKPTPTLLTWQDDLTVMSYQADAASAEVLLRDWAANQDS